MSTVLILSASTGNGHNQAANSLKNELEASGYSVHITDPLREEGKMMDTLIEEGYELLAARMPKVYGKMYKISDYNKLINKGVGNFLKITLRRTIFKLIQQYQPDLLISTHPFYVNVVSYLKAKGKTDLPYIAVVTDYMAHRFYVNKYVDAYIVGSNYTKDTLIEKGAVAANIYNYGIPIRKEFSQPRQAPKDDIFTLLIMGGSMGLSYMKKCLKSLLHNKHEFRVFVVCGNNAKLKDELEAKFSGHRKGKEIIVYGFCPNIPELMDQSDVIITKPGGLTATEAINKNIPMLIPFYIPGQEEENAEILVNAGVAIRITDISKLNEVVDRFFREPSLLENMRRNAQKLSAERSPGDIVQLAAKLIYPKKQKKSFQLNA